MREYKDTQIPFQLIDIAEQMLNKRNNHATKEQYYARLKLIRQFADAALREYEQRHNIKKPNKSKR